MIADPNTIDRPTIGPMPAADYFADHSAWSQSMLKTFMDRRRLAEAYYVTRSASPPAATDPMRKGTATHTAMLEPDRFDELVICYPPGILASNGAVSTKEAKAFRDEHQAAGRVVMKESDLSLVRSMCDSVRDNCGHWIDMASRKEQSVYWIDQESGLPCKLRLDWLVLSPQRVAHVFDLKTTADASPAAFRKQIEDRGYWLQAAHYIAGVEAATGLPCEFRFVAVESDYPFATAVYDLDPKAILDAVAGRRGVLTNLARCLETGNWAEPWERTVTTLPLRPWTFQANQL